MDEDKKPYEISFLLKNEGDREVLRKVLESVKSQVVFEGEVKSVALAYKIKKESQALFGWISFLASPEDVLLIRDKLKTTPVLRFLIVQNPPKKSSPAREAYRARKALTQNAEPPKERQSVLSNEALEQKLKEILQ